MRLLSAESVGLAAADLLTAVRANPPLTDCITNSVVVGFTANVLLALGAAPAMVDIVGEAGPFASVASGLLINLGTPTPEQRAASVEAVEAATAAGTPWVLDPVAVGGLPVRTQLAYQLRDSQPTVVRGNASEILALAEHTAGGRGVDATDEPDDAVEAALYLARTHQSVVAVSGPVDLITDGDWIVRTANGDALLTRVTGGGCALGAVMAAFLGAARSTGHDALTAAAAATLVYTVAAEDAAAQSTGPGSFAVALLDALAAVTSEAVAARADITVVSATHEEVSA